MFNLFGKTEYKVPESQPLWKSGPELEKEPDEYFRVGATNDGRTTLTLVSPGGGSMTLTMNRNACEQMIRMLRATYIEEEPTENEND